MALLGVAVMDGNRTENLVDFRTALVALLQYRQLSRVASQMPLRQRMALRVARRKLAQSVYRPSPEMNKIVYAQTLIGGLGLGGVNVAVQADWNRVRRAAVDFPNLDPAWLTPNQHDIYSPFYKSIMGFPTLTEQDKQDIIGALVLGFALSTSDEGLVNMAKSGPVFYAAGVKSADDIQSGEVTPESRTNSVVGRAIAYAKNRALNYVRQYRGTRRQVEVQNEREFGGTSEMAPDRQVNRLALAQEMANKVLASKKVDTLFAFFSMMASVDAPDKNALADLAIERLKDTKAIKEAKPSDQAAGPDLAEAYFTLIKQGISPTFRDLDQHIFNLSRGDRAKQEFRATNPISAMDWSRTKKEIASVLFREWRPEEVELGEGGAMLPVDQSSRGVRNMMANILLKTRYVEAS